MNTIQYIVVNKELKMSSGKAMAQVAHAIMTAADYEDLDRYFDAVQRTVIVLEGSGRQILNLYDYLKQRGVSSDYVIDEGTNEIPTMSVTALATEAFDIEDIEKRNMFSGFDLYKHGMFQR